MILPFRLRKPARKKSEAMRAILSDVAAILKPGNDAGPHHGIALVPAKGERQAEGGRFAGSNIERI